MTLLARTTARRRETATRANRAYVKAVEKRADEITVVRDVEANYTKIDRKGDLAIESRFQELYNLVDSEQEKQAVVAAYAVWGRSERAEEQVVSGSVSEAAETLKGNNDYWLGSFCPTGSDGAA